MTNYCVKVHYFKVLKREGELEGKEVPRGPLGGGKSPRVPPPNTLPLTPLPLPEGGEMGSGEALLG